jgi:flagellar biosynthesis protein FliQ
MRNGPVLVITIAIFVYSVIFVQTAYAYVDPGTGSYIFQIIVVGVISGLFAMKLCWAKLISFYRKLFQRKHR